MARHGAAVGRNDLINGALWIGLYWLVVGHVEIDAVLRGSDRLRVSVVHTVSSMIGPGKAMLDAPLDEFLRCLIFQFRRATVFRHGHSRFRELRVGIGLFCGECYAPFNLRNEPRFGR
jgi:hypothetical protein